MAAGTTEKERAPVRAGTPLLGARRVLALVRGEADTAAAAQRAAKARSLRKPRVGAARVAQTPPSPRTLRLRGQKLLQEEAVPRHVWAEAQVRAVLAREGAAAPRGDAVAHEYQATTAFVAAPERPGVEAVKVLGAGRRQGFGCSRFRRAEACP